MKIAIRFTVDIDADVWAEEYGVTKAEVRRDVQQYVKGEIIEGFADRGLLAGSGHD